MTVPDLAVAVLIAAIAIAPTYCAPQSNAKPQRQKAKAAEPTPRPFTGEKFIPTDVDWERPAYETSFDDPSVLKDWKLEGGQSMRVANGNLVLASDRKSTQSDTVANHLVAWLTREMPADFLLEFTVRPENRHQGLNIVFFNARGLKGENIFEPPIQPRDGLFTQYHSGDINCYHISYWAGGRGTANLRKNKGFYLVTAGKDLVYDGKPDQFQTIRIYKRGGTIKLMVDDLLSLAWEDDGKTYGPVITNTGWIGLRQMAHTWSCEYGHLKAYPLKAANSKQQIGDATLFPAPRSHENRRMGIPPVLSRMKASRARRPCYDKAPFSLISGGAMRHEGSHENRCSADCQAVHLNAA